MPAKTATTKNVSVTAFPVILLEELRTELRALWDEQNIRLGLRVSDGDAVAHGARCWANFSHGTNPDTVEPAAATPRRQPLAINTPDEEGGGS